MHLRWRVAAAGESFRLEDPEVLPVACRGGGCNECGPTFSGLSVTAFTPWANRDPESVSA